MLPYPEFSDEELDALVAYLESLGPGPILAAAATLVRSCATLHEPQPDPSSGCSSASPVATLTFWGVRGSIPTCGRETIRHGGNTSCVSIEHGDCLVILDAGTGIRRLGTHLLSQGRPGGIEGSILLSHEHWDHIQGLPFFAPLFSTGHRFVIYGEPKRGTLEEIIRNQMREPYFPIELDAFEASIRFVDVGPGHEIQLGEAVSATTHRLTHPNGALGYLLHVDGKRVAYVTDHEHEAGHLSPEVLDMTRGADILIHDSQYSREHLQKDRRGWGHSAWEDVVDLALEARVQTLFLFHHDPDATDEELDDRLARACQRFPGARMAREGLTVRF
jgi:phosphoribosyl 1,2-cyclic phosphodiesterase